MVSDDLQVTSNRSFKSLKSFVSEGPLKIEKWAIEGENKK